MSMKLQTPWEAMQETNAAPVKHHGHTYEKCVHDKDVVIVVYDSQGRKMEVKSVYGAFSDETEVKDDDHCNRILNGASVNKL